ncbi:putative MFS family arabinose efflux permease [Nocardia tenerifensis]|uniref:Putative MFS family arabinose efflux permease n=1 Tax=Nocardia tenerifensis TaxID=228006 RepID=A0A318K8M9_9NOCA|nr:MFS transporter [Nocardia tenerifensis]PXX60413.1 putative MFS family arabinose efflux permease [Nocardia tenerifensis]
MMTVADSTAAADASERVPLRRWFGVAAVALGTFSVVTSEQLPVGLLTSVGGSLDVSEGTAGLMVTVPGLVASATAPLLPVAIGRLDRRVVLLGLITLMVAANVMSAAAPNFAILLASRFLVGVAIGGFWALAAGIAVRMVPAKFVPQATALAFGGATAANVLGIPAGTLIGELTDWRIAFGVLGGLGLVVVVALLLLLPQMPATGPVRLRTLGEQFRNPVVRAGVLVTFLLVSGHYAAFTFVSPILQSVVGIDKTMVGLVLLAFGVAGIAGNFITGAAAGRDIRLALVTISAALAAVLVLVALVGGTPITGVALLVLWGLAFGGIPVGVQTWILRAAPDSTEAATALNTAMFNLAIALGALFGGIIADNVALTAVLWFGAALSVLASLAVWRTPSTRS